MQKLEPDLGVLLLVLRRILEQLAYLHIAILGGLRGIIQILSVSLALPRERGAQVLLGFRSFKFHIL